MSAVLAVLLLATASRADEWVRVATDGLGDASRKQVDALAVYGDHVYIAVHQASATGESRILRASLRRDDVWTDDTPPGGLSSEVSALEIVGGALYAATVDGRLWRRDTGSPWSPVAHPWSGTPAIFHVQGWDPRDGLGLRLCVLREGPVVDCRAADGTWSELPAPPLDDPSSVASGKLAEFDGDLVAGFGGGSADSRPCEAWRYAPASGWSPITTDAFGGWSETGGGLTWITDMEVFERRLYFGTGGHTGALLVRLGPSGIEDVTPHELYDCSSFFGECPARYNALAVTPSRLHVGTRTGGGAGTPRADVLSSADGRRWTRSNEPGFGVDLNDTVTAMGSRSVHLYVGVFNGDGGFQVWRRNYPLAELIPPLYEELWQARLAAVAVRRCLLPFRPCQPPWPELFEPIDEIRLGLALARYGQDDKARIGEAVAGMEEVREMLGTAQELAALAGKAGSVREAHTLRGRAAKLVVDGLALAERTIRPLDDASGR